MQNKILVRSWGYSMTLVDFYEIVKETEKTVTARKLHAKLLTGGGFYGKTEPIIGSYELHENGKVEELVLRKKTPYYINKKERVYAREWDGQPVSYNHCD